MRRSLNPKIAGSGKLYISFSMRAILRLLFRKKQKKEVDFNSEQFIKRAIFDCALCFLFFDRTVFGLRFCVGKRMLGMFNE